MKFESVAEHPLAATRARKAVGKTSEVVKLEPLPVRNAVARALAKRAGSGAAGKHMKSNSAQRAALKRLIKQGLEE